MRMQIFVNIFILVCKTSLTSTVSQFIERIAKIVD